MAQPLANPRSARAEALLARFWRALKTKSFIEDGYVLVTTLNAEAQVPPAPLPGLEVRQVTRADEGLIDQITYRAGFHFEKAVLLHRLERGDLCYASLLDGRVIGYTWMSLDEFRVDCLERRFRMAPDEHYSYDVFVRPEIRGQGIATYQQLVAIREVARRFHHQRLELMFIKSHNHASLKMAAKFGAVRVARLGHLSILGKKIRYQWGRRRLVDCPWEPKTL